MSNMRQCGSMYINFDQENNPEYGFVVDDYRNIITKFYPLCDRQLEKISLPVLPVTAIDNQEMERNLAELAKLDKNDKSLVAEVRKDALIEYAKGGAKIADGCFAGIKRMQIVAPVDYSVMLDWGCFDKDAQIELLLPPDMSLKQVGRMFDTGFDYARENWTIIAHQNFNFASEDRRESYSTFDFDPKKSRYHITVQHLPAQKLQKCLIGNRETTKGLER